MVVLRNVAIVLALAALVAFLPGGGDASQVIGAILSTLIIASFVMLAVRFYREHRFDLVGLGDGWRATLYGAIGVVVLAMAARERLFDSGGGTVLWLAALAGSVYAVYLVWRHSREYS
jgi:glucose uptake protein GlcU